MPISALCEITKVQIPESSVSKKHFLNEAIKKKEKVALISEGSVGKYILSTYFLHNKGIKQKKGLCYWTYSDLEGKLFCGCVLLSAILSYFTFFVSLFCSADLPLSSSADDLLAVPGASDGRHTHFVCVVNDEHEPAAFWRKHPNFTVVPRYKTSGTFRDIYRYLFYI